MVSVAACLDHQLAKHQEGSGVAQRLPGLFRALSLRSPIPNILRLLPFFLKNYPHTGGRTEQGKN